MLAASEFKRYPVRVNLPVSSADRLNGAGSSRRQEGVRTLQIAALAALAGPCKLCSCVPAVHRARPAKAEGIEGKPWGWSWADSAMGPTAAKAAARWSEPSSKAKTFPSSKGLASPATWRRDSENASERLSGAST